MSKRDLLNFLIRCKRCQYLGIYIHIVLFVLLYIVILHFTFYNHNINSRIKSLLQIHTFI